MRRQSPHRAQYPRRAHTELQRSTCSPETEHLDRETAVQTGAPCSDACLRGGSAHREQWHVKTWRAPPCASMTTPPHRHVLVTGTAARALCRTAARLLACASTLCPPRWRRLSTGKTSRWTTCPPPSTRTSGRSPLRRMEVRSFGLFWGHRNSWTPTLPSSNPSKKRYTTEIV